MQKSMPKKLRKMMKNDGKMEPTWTKNRCQNRSERKKEIFRKVLFFLRKTMHFEDPRGQNPIKNQRKINKKAIQKRVQKLTSFFIVFSSIFAVKINLKIDKNSTKKLTKTRHEKRSEKGPRGGRPNP